MSSRTSLAAGIALVIAGAAASGRLIATSSTPQTGLTAAATTIRLPAGVQLNKDMTGPSRTDLALSPDGSLLVFSASPDGKMEHSKLYRQPLDGSEASLIAGAADGACMPAFSPDGQWLAFWAAGKLFKVGARSGSPTVVCDLANRPVGVSWASNGKILFGTQGSRGGIRQVSAEGGTHEPLTKVDSSTEATHRLPQALPGGKAIIFTVMPYQFGADAWIEMQSLETGQRTLLIKDGSDARYLPTGHLVFMRRGMLMAVPFRPDRPGAITQAPQKVVGVAQALNAPSITANSGAGLFSVSESGSLAFVRGGMYPEPLAELAWVDRSGRAETLTAFGSRPVVAVRVSPNGRLLALTMAGINYGLWVYDIPQNKLTRLTTGGQVAGPLWTPDGKRITFTWTKKDVANIWSVAADGREVPEALNPSDLAQRCSSWSPDGRHLALVETKPAGGNDVMVWSVADKRMMPFAVSKADEVYPEFSPDGRWIAYVSNESGRNEVYVRSFPDGRRTLQISTEGGASPVWGPEGREICYWDLTFKKMMRAGISPGENLSADAPSQLFESKGQGLTLLRTFALAPDGKRFLLRQARDTAVTPVTELSLVRNWFADLRRISPPGQ